jgi:tRNA uridine 5-carboxymethylaminomethyl modification enzyme
MFTSRAEFRILLRQDNADTRLTEMGYKIGLAEVERYEKVMKKKEEVNSLLKELKTMKVEPLDVNENLHDLNTATITEKIAVEKLLKRPEIGIKDIQDMDTHMNQYLSTFSLEVLEQAEILIKYQTYIDKEEKLAHKIESFENLKIDPAFNYSKITALSAEAKEKLNKIKPETIGQASRISGVTPADISIIMVYLGK